MSGSSWMGVGGLLVTLAWVPVLHGQRLVPPADKELPKVSIPKEYLPPAGMCRVWIDNVPAAQQPAPTDCVTAIKNRPTNGRVIFGDDAGIRLKGLRRTLDEGTKDSTKLKVKKP
ncbi:MAG: hypothetical protein U0132_05705 [Gemmatimonadaceae bacterium]